MPPAKHTPKNTRKASAKKPAAKQQATKKPASGSSSALKRLFWRLFALLVIWGGILGFGFLIYILHDLPPTDNLDIVREKPGIVLLDAKGKTFASYGELYGDYLKYEEFPRSLIDALIATEDRRFFDHSGIDPIGLARAMWRNWLAGTVVQGGSTLSQQLAKNLFLSADRTFKRKLQEVILALWLEHKFTKKQIMTLYLNRVYLGAGTYGVDAAARRYFDKSARKLNLSEAAMIVGLLKAPSRYSPTNNPVKAERRAKQVILNMQNAGLISEGIAKAAMQYPARAQVAYGDRSNSYYFADWVMSDLAERFGRLDEDVVVKTTFDRSMQAAMEEAVDPVMAKRPHEQMAGVLMLPDGAVTAMMGGRGYRESQFNRATQALRQPGSSFKLFPYLAALQAGWSLDSVIDDAPLTIGKWRPENYSKRYRGPITLQTAFAESVNTVAVRLSENVGRSRVIALAKQLGIESPLTNLPAIALGASEVTLLEMTGAYAHIANGGQSVRPYGIVSVRRKADNQLLYHHVAEGKRVLGNNETRQMHQLLQSVVSYGTGRAARLPYPTAGKTGTSQNYRDAWFIGYTPKLVGGIWLGRDDGTSMGKITGGSIPAESWKVMMTKAHPLAPQPASSVESLPWISSAPAAPASTTRRPAAPARKSGGGSLWDSFFDSLKKGDDGNRGKVEYDYPTGGRR